TPVATETISNTLLNAFEVGDLRYDNWLGNITDGTTTWFFPFKYKVKLSPSLEEYSMVFRLAEQYLIRAEARAQLNDFSGALLDLNTIRNRAGLPDVNLSSQETMLTAIYKERQVELFSEWGHRWYDLKRSNRIDQVLSSVKPQWVSTAKLYPIPIDEVSRNGNITQNPGY
ncbi:RagB/SusD family nutrient uptake outer membrane protein, partial [Tamlana sp. 2_MG-2023]|uniref:RagB/SusD family nutrient uptake outer membrane protein n=1 Tax=unclassified Tamlana TaxID=2614803 RepID=UPI0026E3AC10